LPTLVSLLNCGKFCQQKPVATFKTLRFFVLTTTGFKLDNIFDQKFLLQLYLNIGLNWKSFLFIYKKLENKCIWRRTRFSQHGQIDKCSNSPLKSFIFLMIQHYRNASSEKCMYIARMQRIISLPNPHGCYKVCTHLVNCQSFG
jgi:hypothetical protein